MDRTRSLSPATFWARSAKTVNVVSTRGRWSDADVTGDRLRHPLSKNVPTNSVRAMQVDQADLCGLKRTNTHGKSFQSIIDKSRFVDGALLLSNAVMLTEPTAGLQIRREHPNA